MRQTVEPMRAADHGAIGDGRGWALVGRDGAISRMHVPEPYDQSLFDPRHSFVLAPEKLRHSRQYYLPGTAVLVTEMHGPTGVIEVTDTFTLGAGADLTDPVPAPRGELLRYVRVLQGDAVLCVEILPQGGLDITRCGGGLRLRGISRNTDLHLLASRPLTAQSTAIHVNAGDDLWLLLRWNADVRRVHQIHPHRLLEQTAAAWRRWSGNIAYAGPEAAAVHRSAVTVKLFSHSSTQHAAGAAYALRHIGLVSDGNTALGRALDVLEDSAGPAHGQGEFFDCAYEWTQSGGAVDQALWSRLTALADATSEPPAGCTTDAAAGCHMTLDRAARLANDLGSARRAGWSSRAVAVQNRILHEAWDETQQCLTNRLGPGGVLDPRLLNLPCRRVVAADHPRMAATSLAIADRLNAGNGLLHSDGQQGAMLAHSFWLADNLLAQGRAPQASLLYRTMCGQANGLGLLPERIEPDGGFLGRFPDLAAHVAVIGTGVALANAET